MINQIQMNCDQMDNKYLDITERIDFNLNQDIHNDDGESLTIKFEHCCGSIIDFLEEYVIVLIFGREYEVMDKYTITDECDERYVGFYISYVEFDLPKAVKRKNRLEKIFPSLIKLEN